MLQTLFLIQECIPVGCVQAAAVAVGGCLHQAPSPGADIPAVNRMTDACENITLPQLRCGR